MGESVPKTCDEPHASTRVTGDHPADLMKRSALAQISGEINLGTIAHLGLKPKGNSETHLGLNETSREEQVRDINGLSTIKTLASQFLEAIKLWEKSSEEITKEKMVGEKVADGKCTHANP
ncbi:hypothetical protein RDI58_003986 [Solanum bulbocastanum]|uniref:Uncharacterized protein n=1 Tax=Solanum bulbocastanum TaxID=147425 RepID=A0AAN8YKV2_SOLBU